MLDWHKSNLPITRLKEQASHCEVGCSQAKKARSTSNKNAGVFCDGILHELLIADADTKVRNLATNLQDIALLDGHPVKYLSMRGLVQNLGNGARMIVQKHGHQSGLLIS